MKQRGLLVSIRRWWRRTGQSQRLVIGTALVLGIWLGGLTPRSLAGIDIAWPYAFLCAAVGWSRIGVSIRPMLVLVLLGLLQDLFMTAPLGAHTIVALATYGAHAAAGNMLDLDNDPLVARLLPFGSLGLGLALVWLLATVSAGHAVSLAPLILAGVTTVLLYLVIEPVLDLRVRSSASRQGG